MICETCKKEHDGTYGSGRFCSRSCSCKRTLTKEYKEKIRASNKKYAKGHPYKHSEQTKKRLGLMVKTTKPISNLFDLSNNTRIKVVQRLDIRCSNCGWDQCLCDIHHIDGRKIEDPHNHNNLCYLCPNCHRLAGKGLIKKENLITFQQQVGDRWKECLYMPV